jgi:hypothetical protein
MIAYFTLLALDSFLSLLLRAISALLPNTTTLLPKNVIQDPGTIDSRACVATFDDSLVKERGQGDTIKLIHGQCGKTVEYFRR